MSMLRRDKKRYIARKIKADRPAFKLILTIKLYIEWLLSFVLGEKNGPKGKIVEMI